MSAATCVGATRSFAVSHERGASSGTGPGALRGAELRGQRPKRAPLRGRLPAPRPGDTAQPRAPRGLRWAADGAARHNRWAHCARVPINFASLAAGIAAPVGIIVGAGAALSSNHLGVSASSRAAYCALVAAPLAPLWQL